MAETPLPETTEDALEAYGYVLGDEVWSKPTAATQAWSRTEDGSAWHRFDPARPAAGVVFGVVDPSGGQPWGQPAMTVEGTPIPGWVLTPYKQLGGPWAGVSGLHPAVHPEAFGWEWPDREVYEIYAYNHFNGPWKRLDDGTIVRDEEAAAREG